MWKLKDEYRQIMLDLEDIQVEEGSLLADNITEDDDGAMDRLDTEWPDEEVKSLDTMF